MCEHAPVDCGLSPAKIACAEARFKHSQSQPAIGDKRVSDDARTLASMDGRSTGRTPLRDAGPDPGRRGRACALAQIRTSGPRVRGLFSIVASAATGSPLPLRPTAGPEQKLPDGLERLVTRLVVRGCRCLRRLTVASALARRRRLTHRQ
jgi:hypothetical protein